ncbi:hypothetical protein SEA_KEANU_39 [Streptomyces phage Keanu]|nr:hypothetical protein SEA_KEANU_39 [Streptomyces phage Keanu]
MPYRKEKRGSKWVVVKIKKASDGTESTEVVGKHDTEEQAKKQLAALKINVEDA